MAIHQFQFALRHSRLRGCRYRNLAVVCDVITRSSPAGIAIAPTTVGSKERLAHRLTHPAARRMGLRGTSGIGDSGRAGTR